MIAIEVRNQTAAEEDFVRRLILETVSRELGADQWPDPVRAHLLEIQYKGRIQGLRTRFPHGESRIIWLDGQPAGWLYVAELEDEVRLAEIMVLPEYRGKGLASTAIRQVLAGAASSARPVRLMVNVLNANAIRLYERLGFQRTGGTEVQHEMEARP
jgi:ribosomal protein S18 acetylase RimI-like enzyme